MELQSRLLTGILTGTGRWNGGGDTPFEGRRSGRPLPVTPGAEAERLAMVSRKADRVVRIKTSNARET
jgi:hypothetical protein